MPQVLHIRMTDEDLKLIDAEAKAIEATLPGLGKPSRPDVMRMLVRRLKISKKEPRSERQTR